MADQDTFSPPPSSDESIAEYGCDHGNTEEAHVRADAHKQVQPAVLARDAQQEVADEANKEQRKEQHRPQYESTAYQGARSVGARALRRGDHHAGKRHVHQQLIEPLLGMVVEIAELRRTEPDARDKKEHDHLLDGG